MSSVNGASIDAKIKSWSSSAKGQSKMRATVKKYMREDKRRTEAGSEVLTKALMYELGRELVSMITQRASAAGLPSSVQSNVDSLECGSVKMFPDGSMSCELAFTGDLTRPSLQPQWRYQGEETISGGYSGVRNIIAIFNNGYEGANPKLWGYWHGAIWHAKESREGERFINQAVEEFQAKYGARYNISVEIIGPY